MQIRILGPVEVHGEGAVSTLTGPKQRLILALLALHTGEVISIEKIIDLLWEDDPPATAIDQVYAQVSRLRRELAAALPPGTDRQPIITRPPGYVLRVEPGELDLHDFEARYARGRTLLSEGDPQRARDVLVQALARWRSPVLGDAADRLPAEADRLEGRWQAALDDRIEADLAIGRAGELVPELRSLVAAQPLHERLLGQLMRALARAGRPAEALAEYAVGRQRIVDELGVEPGPALRALHEAVLRNDPALDAVDGIDRLPADPSDFTGREEEAERGIDLLTGAMVVPALHRSVTATAEAPRVCVISGRPGVGKTALAIRLAHRLRSTFTDGVLTVDLSGGDNRPKDPGVALADLLAALGVRRAEIPDTLVGRAALYRLQVSGRRLLIVLDNAEDERQLARLLPDAGPCAVVVTSRSRLSGLGDPTEASPCGGLAVGWLDLDVLDEDRSVRLLGRLIGTDRISAEPEATATLVRQCGRLPLALRIAGARLSADPDWPVAGLVERLADEHRRLDELAAADLEVRAGLTSAIAGMGERQRRLFGLLGLLQVPDFSSWVAAALLDISTREAEDALDDLVRAHVLQTDVDQCGQARYRFHDLVHLLAREYGEELPVGVRREPLVRALTSWLALTTRAEWRLSGGFFSGTGDEGPQWQYGCATAEKLLADPIGWFRSELGALSAVVRLAVANERPDLASAISGVTVTYFAIDRRYDEWRETHHVALMAVRSAGDRQGEAVVLRGLAELLMVSDHNTEAAAHLERASELFRAIGDRFAEAFCTSRLGTIHRLHGRNDQASRCLESAIAVFAELGSQRAESHAGHHLGVLQMERGRTTEAKHSFERALDLARQCGFALGEASPLRGLGLLSLRHGDLAGAETYLTASRGAARALGDDFVESLAMMLLAEVYVERGRHREALEMLQVTRAAFQRVNDRFNNAYATRLIGEAHRRSGELEPARPAIERAVWLWKELDMPLWHARGLVSLGDLHRDRGDRSAAEASWWKALETFERLGAVETEQVADRLRQAP